jgi:2-polyprenyl-6-methoxyphenol hydroxylase-like FAD-dependent oxidoreductase
VDRLRFDRMLVEAAEAAGAEIFRGVRMLSCEHDCAGRWHVQAQRQGGVLEMTADVLIDATGRGSWLARRLGTRRQVFDRLVAMIGFGKSSGGAGTAVESSSDGWWYGATLPAGRGVAVFFTDSDLIARGSVQRSIGWSAGLQRTRLVSRYVSEMDESQPLRILSASTTKLENTAGLDWIAIGDAACTIDPLSGQGVTVALDSALEAATAICARRPGEPNAFQRTESGVCMRFEQARMHQARSYSQENRWADSVFWTA